MTDSRKNITGYEAGAEIEHDEYHSTLEVDDTSGWRVFIVPGLLLLFLIGALSIFLLYSNSELGPDPRAVARAQAKQKAQAEEQARVEARQQAAQAAATQQAQQAAAGGGNAAGQ
jgi:hypothetical protein